ncbi:MAG: hypothetical protein QOH02_193 [Gaiellaceae bacterium]|nr:hypothetical protein [Gaiellaceae bacterium]
MSLRLAVGVAGAATACLCPTAAAAAGPALLGLPSPVTPLTAQPPLGVRDARVPGRRPRGRVDARTRVIAELDASGAPVAVSAIQRLTIHGVGDYFFAIPAPLRDVLPGPGTQSEPGLRPGMVLWQGFSGGTRILSARLLLEPDRVAPLLPIRVRLTRTGSLATLELVNTTAVRVSSITAVAEPRDARRYLQSLARFAAGGALPFSYVKGRNHQTVQRTVVVPVHVTGTLLAGRRPVRLDLVLGAQPRRVRVATGSTRQSKLRLEARPIPWRNEPAARPTFDDAMESALRVARERQYEMFLSSPDPAGASRTTYVFRTVAPHEAATSARPRHHSGSPYPAIAIALGLGALLMSAVVAWAHA